MPATAKWTKEAIRELLDTNDRAVARGLIRLYERQTEDEQRAQDTKHHNGVGFNGTDGHILTSIAQQALKYGGTLTPKQTALVRRRIRKYAGQLADMANHKEQS